MRNVCTLHRTSAAFPTLCCILIKEHMKTELNGFGIYVDLNGQNVTQYR